MKPKGLAKTLLGTTALTAAIVVNFATSSVSAATIDKADNTDNLNLTSSWSGGIAPGAFDIARWSGLAGANTVALGADTTWKGITIATTGGPVTISAGNTLTLGTAGIDMSAASQDLTINSNLNLASGNQVWNVATGRTLTVAGTFSRSPGATLIIDKTTNTGTVTAAPTLTNGVLPWAIVRSAGTAANGTAAGYNFATVTGGNLVAYTGATAVTTGYPASSATTNYDWSANGTQGAIGSSRAANTIRYTGTGVTQATNSTQTQTFNALMNAGTGTVTLGGGSTMNIQSATGELLLAAMSANIVINGPIINNGATAGAVTILSAGSNAVTLGGTSTFTGNLVINGNLNAGTGQGAAPTASNLGALQPASNRNIIVNEGGVLSLTAGNVLGTGGSTNTLANTTLVVNAGGVFQTGLNAAGTGWWNKIGAVNLNGGTIRVGSGANNTAFQGLALIGTVTAGGNAASLIENHASSNSTTNGIHLGQNAGAGQSIIFDVADVTGSTATDLHVSAKLLNTSANLTASGLTKNGVGTMTLSGDNAYTGGTVVNTGTLQIGNGGTTGSLAGASAITNNAALVYNRSNDLSQSNAISGTGSLTKTGAGTLTLTGANSYSGATNVSNGTLAFSTSTQSLGSSAFSVADNAGLSVRAASAGSSLLNTGNLTLGSSGTTTLTFDFNNLNTTAALINAGVFTVNGTVNVSLLNGSLLGNGTHALVDYSSFAGSGILPGGSISLGARSSGTLVNDIGNTVLNLDVVSDTPKWTGLDSGVWAVGSTGASSNWKLITGGTATDYIAGDVVLFDDSAAGTTSVTIDTNVSPTSTTFNNSSLAYTLSGTAGIAGTGSLTKSGSAALTINNANTYSGGTVLNAGTLNVNNASALGSGAVTINGGTLDNNSGGAIVLSANNAQNWNGDFTFTGSNDLDLGTGAVTVGGAGTRQVTVSAGTLTAGELKTAPGQGFTKQGAGTLVLTSDGNGGAASVVNGELNVAGGTLQMNRAAGNNGDFTAAGLTGGGNLTNGAAVERWFFSNAASGSYDFSGSLANGGTGALGFNKSGASTQTLSGSNSYTGTTTISAGELVITGTNSGAGTNVALSGTGTSLVLGNTQALGAASLINVSGGTSNVTVRYATDGGDTGYDYSMSSGATLNVVLDRATSGADVTHNLSTATTGSGFGSGTINITKGSNVTGSATASFDTFNLGGGSGGTTTIVTSTGTNVVIGSVTKSNNNVSQTLGLGGTTTGNEVTGAITNGAAVGANSIGVTKTGSGTWTLSGNSTYTGATNVNEGTLVIASTGSLGNTTINVASGATFVNNGATNSSFTVAANATLGGSGVFNGALTVNGNLSPGNSPEVIVVNNDLTLGSASTTTMEIGSFVRETGYDGVDVNGDLDGSVLTYGGTLNIIAYDLGEGLWDLAQAGVYDLFAIDTDVTTAGNFSFVNVGATNLSDGDADGIWTAVDGGNPDVSYTFSQSTGDLTVTVVPEPGAALLGGLGLLGLLRRRRVA